MPGALAVLTMRARPWTLVLAALAVVLLGTLAFAARMHRQMRDFEVYWMAGARVSAGAPLYRAEDGHYRFKYLPGFAVAVSPLSRLPLVQAKAAWFAGSIACLAAFIALSVLSIPEPGVRPGLVALLATAAMAKFFAHELVLGQVNLFFGLICVAALGALIRGRELPGGLGLGLAALVKPYAVVFLPYLLATRRWLAAAALCASLAVVLILPVPGYGLRGAVDLTASWWRTASETSAPLLTNADSTSVFAMYAKWIGWGMPAAVLSFATLALLATMFALVLARRGGARVPEYLEGAVLLTLIPLATPQGWDYVLLLSTPLVALLIARAPSMPRPERWITTIVLAVVALSIYDVIGRTAYRAFMDWSIITLCYLALLLVAVRLRLRGAA